MPFEARSFEPVPRRVTIEDFHFEKGAHLAELRIGFWSAGTFNDRGDNAIFLCPGASATRDRALPFCRVGGASDPARWFLISADMPGGGSSSRASTDPGDGDDHGRAVAARSACPLLLLQAESDMLFPVADATALAGDIAGTEFAVIDTPLGHMAAAALPGTPEFAFYDSRTAAFLTRLEALQ